MDDGWWTNSWPGVVARDPTHTPKSHCSAQRNSPLDNLPCEMFLGGGFKARLAVFIFCAKLCQLAAGSDLIFNGWAERKKAYFPKCWKDCFTTTYGMSTNVKRALVSIDVRPLNTPTLIHFEHRYNFFTWHKWKELVYASRNCYVHLKL